MAHYLTRKDERLRDFSTKALVEEILTRVRSDRALASTIGEDDPTTEETTKVLQAAVVEIGVLRAHLHEWSEESYCTVCGLDGRA